MNADRTVLVVDDTPAHRYLMASWLRRAGFGVVEAGTGRDALAHATTPVDAVVLDVNLPDLSGREVCRILKSDPTTAHLPVLHVSATDVDAAARTAGLEGGADAYLPEPLDRDEFLATISALSRGASTPSVVPGAPPAAWRRSPTRSSPCTRRAPPRPSPTTPPGARAPSSVAP